MMMPELSPLESPCEHLKLQRQAIGPQGSKPDADPGRRPRFHTIISVDDHLVEPPHLFEGRMPAKFADRTPRVIDRDHGTQAWLLDQFVLDEIALNAVAGNEIEDKFIEPMRFDVVRPGTWDIKARIEDMDIDGVYASLNFPSALGFGGVRLTMLDDAEFVLALVRAYNDWQLEEWAGYRPDRIIPCQIPYLLDATIAADEVRANAARGFHTITFPDLTHLIGLPSLHTDYWDPLWAACEETGTVLSVHACSGGMANKIDPMAPTMAEAVFFGAAQSLHPAIEWIFAKIPERFPDLRICLSEGGIGWVVGLMDRLDHMVNQYGGRARWKITPRELLERNFTFCMLDDPTTLHHLRHKIGVKRIVIEADYPHGDSSWPETQAQWGQQFDGIPAEEVTRMAWANASELFQHPVPVDVAADPNAF